MEWGCIKVNIGLDIGRDDPRFEGFKRSFDHRKPIANVGYDIISESPLVVSAVVTKRQAKELGRLEYVTSIAPERGNPGWFEPRYELHRAQFRQYCR